MSETWIIGYDFSQCSETALDFAAEELSQTGGGKLILVHVYRRPHKQVGFELSQLSRAIKPLDDAEQILREVIEGRLQKVAVRTKEKFPVLEITVRLEEGHAATRVAQVCTEENAKICVMGTHGHRGLKRVFLGSVTQQVLTLSPCPVLVVRRDETDDSTTP